MHIIFITKLPTELIAFFPDYLHCLDDLYALLQTSRLLYNCCASTKAKLAPPFAKKHGQHLLPPHPLLLLAGPARQIGERTIGSDANRQRLWEVIKEGNDGLALLCKEVTRLSLDDIRAIHQPKYDIINPLSPRLDLDHGQGEKARNGSYYTVCEDVETALYNYLICCELFHLDVEAPTSHWSSSLSVQK